MIRRILVAAVAGVALLSAGCATQVDGLAVPRNTIPKSSAATRPPTPSVLTTSRPRTTELSTTQALSTESSTVLPETTQASLPETTQASQLCEVYESGGSARVAVESADAEGECQKLLKSLSTGGAFWTESQQAYPTEGLASFCIMDFGTMRAEIISSRASGEGTALCSSFVQAGWTEDGAAEQQQAASVAAASSSAAAQQKSAADQQAEQSALATLVRDASLDSELSSISGDVKKTAADVAQTRADAKAGGGDNCVNASSTVYNDAASAVYNDAQSSLYNDVNTLTQADQSVQKDIAAVQSANQQLASDGLPVDPGASSAISAAQDTTATAKSTANGDIDMIGSTPLGDMGPQTNQVLIAAYPLDRVDCVNVQVKEGPRGPKEQRLTIMSSRNGVAVIAVDHIEMVWTAGGFRPFRGSRVDLLDAMVAPVATARRAAATGPELAHLDAVLAGARTHTGDALSVTFITDKPLPYPPVASDAQLHVPLTPTTAPSAAGSRSCTHVECPAREVPTDAGSCPTCGRTTHHIAVHRGDEPMEMGPQPTRQESIDEPADFPQRTDIDVSPADSSRFCTRVGCAQRGTRTAALRCESCGLPTSPISGKRSWTTAADHTQAQRSDTNVQQRPQPNSPTPIQSQPRQPTPLGKDGSHFCIRFGCPLSGAPTDAFKCENCDFPTSVISGYIGLTKVVSTPPNVAPAASPLAADGHDEAAASSTAHQAQQSIRRRRRGAGSSSPPRPRSSPSRWVVRSCGPSGTATAPPPARHPSRSRPAHRPKCSPGLRCSRRRRFGSGARRPGPGGASGLSLVELVGRFCSNYLATLF